MEKLIVKTKEQALSILEEKGYTESFVKWNGQATRCACGETECITRYIKGDLKNQMSIGICEQCGEE